MVGSLGAVPAKPLAHHNDLLPPRRVESAASCTHRGGTALSKRRRAAIGVGALLTPAALAAPAHAEIGSAGLGDPYFPLAGNGGY
jgi:hypothetical protein